MKHTIRMGAAALMLPLLCVPGTALPAASERQAVEVGTVEWGRDFEGALEESERTGKPVLVLFQEVPGCAGCKKFGREVLTHPVIVSVMESEFIPVLVYNNRPGRDAEIAYLGADEPVIDTKDLARVGLHVVRAELAAVLCQHR